MSTREFPRDHVQFVAAGYNDACTNFQVQFNRFEFDLLRKAITKVGSYNEYQGRLVAAAFKKIERLVLSAEFGREGSPVLYIHLRREDIDDPGKGNPIGVDEVMNTFTSMKKSRPDEADVDPFNNALLRFWWD